MLKTKKKKNIPFHIAQNYMHYELSDGLKFWARDDEDAALYRKKLGSIGIFEDGMLFHNLTEGNK